MSPLRASVRRPVAPLRLGVWLVVLWVCLPMPLLALPVDWAQLCGCDDCPFEGGPSCCCKRFPTFENADGSAGKRARFSGPTVGKDRTCVGAEATLTAADPLSKRAAGPVARLRPVPKRPRSLEDQRIPVVRDVLSGPVTLPRPPPLSKPV